MHPHDGRDAPGGMRRRTEALVRHYLDRARPDGRASWAPESGRRAACGSIELSFAVVAGSDGRSGPATVDYYAVRVPGFLVEYDNTQNGAESHPRGLARAGERLAASATCWRRHYSGGPPAGLGVAGGSGLDVRPPRAPAPGSRS